MLERPLPLNVSQLCVIFYYSFIGIVVSRVEGKNEDLWGIFIAILYSSEDDKTKFFFVCVCERNNSSIMIIKPYADENSILIGKISLDKSIFTPVCGASRRYQSLVIIYWHTMLEELASTYNRMIL